MHSYLALKHSLNPLVSETTWHEHEPDGYYEGTEQAVSMLSWFGVCHYIRWVANGNGWESGEQERVEGTK